MNGYAPAVDSPACPCWWAIKGRQQGVLPPLTIRISQFPSTILALKHPYELPPVHYTVIRAMGEQMGVGGDDSWGANVHPEYIPDVTKPVEFTFTFRGI